MANLREELEQFFAMGVDPEKRAALGEYPEAEWQNEIEHAAQQDRFKKWDSKKTLHKIAKYAPTLPLRLHALGYLVKHSYEYEDALKSLLETDTQDADGLWDFFVESLSINPELDKYGLTKFAFARSPHTSPETKKELFRLFPNDTASRFLASNPTTPPDLMETIFNYGQSKQGEILHNLAENEALPQDMVEKLWGVVKSGKDRYIASALAKNKGHIPDRIRQLAKWTVGEVTGAELEQAWAENPDDESREAMSQWLDPLFAFQEAQNPGVNPRIRALLLSNDSTSTGVLYKDRAKIVENDLDLQTPKALRVMCKSKAAQPSYIVKLAAKRLDPVEDSHVLNHQLGVYRSRPQELSEAEQADIANEIGHKLSQVPAKKFIEAEAQDEPVLDLARHVAVFATHPESLKFPAGFSDGLDSYVVENKYADPNQIDKIYRSAKSKEGTGYDTELVLRSVAKSPSASPQTLSEIAEDVSLSNSTITAVTENPRLPIASLIHIAKTRPPYLASVAYSNPSMPESERHALILKAVDQTKAAAAKGELANTPEISIAGPLLTDRFRGEEDGAPVLSQETVREAYQALGDLVTDDTEPIVSGITKHPHFTPVLMHDLLDKYEATAKVAPRTVLQNLVRHSNVDVEVLKRIADNKNHDRYVAEYAKEKMAELVKDSDPDSIHDEHVNVKFGTNKMRILRDKIGQLGGDEAKPSQLPKELVQALGNTGRLPNGNYSARLLQRLIDAAPETRLNISHDTWSGAQRHNNEDSNVLQVNISTAQLNKLKEAGVYDTYKKLREFTSEAHPVNKSHGIGWIRWTGNHNGIHIDEIQSDMGQGFSKQFGSAIDAAVEQGRMSKEEGERKKAQIAKDYPQDHLKKIEDILFGGKHSSEFLFEAFLEWARKAKHKVEEKDPEEVEGGLVGTPVHIWDVEGKAPISGWSDKQKEGGKTTGYPKHGMVGYREAPKKAGFKPSTYGTLPTQDNPNHKAVDPENLLVDENGQLPETAKPTWAEEIRKHEELEALFKADPKVWAAGDYKIPHYTHPSRKQFDENYRSKLEDFFITPGFDKFVERTVPIEKLLGQHDVPSSDKPARTKLYTRMYAAGDPGLPMVVSPGANGFYHIVDGNRRLLAAQAAGVKQLKVLSKERVGGRVRKSEVLAKAEPKLPPNVQKAFEAVRGALTDDLRKPKYRGHPNRYHGQCYVAAEGLYHILGGSDAGWVPQFIPWEGEPHWYLKHPATGTVLDPTAEQFKKPVPYHEGSGKGFLTKQPSKRAQILIDRVKGNL